ncbi:MAG: hypothetical protein COW85_12640 [Ignavibacteria bacterium CG22_combo_CG10-13_8_21_14_all_37_15]|nr:MAG: hypothetical protein COW85_12640 [Ignavibacteria bacterium CG22_combo_CG10-13_8_21_14_all_37_15]
MKTKLFIILLTALLSTAIFSQNITNTLGTGGSFIIWDGASTFFSLPQSTGTITLSNGISLSNSNGSEVGVIYKEGGRFIHNYQASGTTGNNSFVGMSAGNFTMSGTGNQSSSNTAVGSSSLSSLTTGYFNSAVGVGSLQNNTEGYNNSAFGMRSLYNNTTGYFNTAAGNNALYSNLTGTDNSAFGTNSLQNNSTGSDNSAYGMNSLTHNTTGGNNSAFGGSSLLNNTTGSNNSAFGMDALVFNSEGTNNSAFGDNSLTSNTTGLRNSAVGSYSLYSNTTGSDNSALGRGAGYSITSGSNNIAVGNDAQVPNGAADNQVKIGNSSISYAGIQVAWTITSDRRLKSNIQNSNLGLNFISNLRPVSYFRNNDKSQKTEYGFIAQEVEELLRSNESENTGMISKDAEGTYSLRYNDLFAPLVNAIQELKHENDQLKVKNEVAQAANENLKTTTVRLNERLTKFEKMQTLLVAEIEKLKANNDETTKVSLGTK